MRIGIDYRLLSGRVHSGMGRYTQQQLREVLRLDSRNGYVLFCREDADVADILPEISAAPNVSIAWLPAVAGRAWDDLNRPADLQRATAELQRTIAEQEVDVFHATTPCYLDDFVPSRLDDCPLVATHYDLIPLHFSQHYLAYGAFHRSLYLRALDLLRQADRVVAISEHVRREALEHLGVPLDRIRVAYPVADPCFRRLSEEERERILTPLRESLGLDGEFLLSVSPPHHSKNLPALIEAFRRLPSPVRRRLRLVLARDLLEEEEATVRLWAREGGIEDELVLPGFLPDRELAALYNAATMVVHPSRYEGFGLPVLEAMRCGAAVIAGNASSLPEVAGDAGLLVDPEDPAALARAIETLAGDPSLRRELGERAIERAARFRPEDLGRNTLEIYEEAIR